MSPLFGRSPPSDSSLRRKLPRARQLRLESLERRCLLAGFLFTVTTNLDVVDAGDGLTSLREAITQSNQLAASDDTINFQAGLSGTIALDNAGLTISDSVTINGPGANRLAVRSDGSFGVIAIENASTVVLSGLTITGGGNVFAGAGVLCEPGANLTLDRMTITDNRAVSIGGGVAGDDFLLTILNSTISNNRAAGSGAGGILHTGPEGHDASNPALRVINSTISGNESAGRGGGVLIVASAAEFRNCTITGNRPTNSMPAQPGAGAASLRVPALPQPSITPSWRATCAAQARPRPTTFPAAPWR